MRRKTCYDGNILQHDEEVCSWCDGCGIVKNQVCKVCNGHGILVGDKITGQLHTYAPTQVHLKAMKTLGNVS
jgi:DnaJ-class molecular chaperone